MKPEENRFYRQPDAESMAVAIPPTHVADLPALMHLASQLVPTGFLPDHIKTPGQAVAIILAGRELGVGPMLALRSIYMIKGKIELSADLQLSLFKRDGGRAHFVELTADKAQLKLNHPNGDTHLETFTMEDAKRAGLSGDNWRKYPKAMLRSRVITAALKSVGFEPKMSGCYAPGEVGGPEIVDVVAETVPPASPEPKQSNGDKPLAKRINDMANWVVAQIGPVDGEWLVPYLRAHTPDGGDKSAALMPNEMLDALSEASLAAIKADPKGFLARVKQFAQENDQVPGAEVSSLHSNRPPITTQIGGLTEKPDELWHRDTVYEVTTKSGETKGKPWTLFGIRVGNEWFNTFSKTLAEAATRLQGQFVELCYETTPKGKNAIAIDDGKEIIRAGQD